MFTCTVQESKVNNANKLFTYIYIVYHIVSITIKDLGDIFTNIHTVQFTCLCTVYCLYLIARTIYRYMYMLDPGCYS